MSGKPPVTTDIDTYYPIAGVADALNVSTKTIYRWIESGELVAHKFGRQWRISKTDLETFLKLRRCGS
jgi:excisionase family DNA binding protein